MSVSYKFYARVAKMGLLYGSFQGLASVVGQQAHIRVQMCETEPPLFIFGYCCIAIIKPLSL
ncbi:hypothetical protein OS493_010605 [Desmophyllum pertusum]|uniref:Uncharacterized protein n=1 Tax=Desmophyllum pertusum TaxID=174260 RepID=A0A9W9ZQT2_9CNID|nr:hypothetical protein OS493_010605 [Desmophyllum pertusum]